MTQGSGDRRRHRAPPAPNPRRLAELDRRDRHRAVARTALIVAAAWVLLGLIYVTIPGRGFSGWRQLFRLTTSMAAVAAVFAWQTRSVARSAMPELRAVQALGVIIPLFLLVFATTYLSMSNASAGSFTEPLDHIAALYFTITVFATVGFGDITASSGPARLVVSLQMMLDLVLIGFAVRAIFGVARNRMEQRSDDDA